MLGAVYDKELALMTFMEVIKIVSEQLSFFDAIAFIYVALVVF